MYLSKFRVKNYKSFRDSGEIEFKPGINVIVGQNNSGKTALLEAIQGGNLLQVFKSEKSQTVSQAEIEVTLRASIEDLNPFLLDVIFIGFPLNNDLRESVKHFNDFVNETVSNGHSEFKVLRTSGNSFDFSKTLNPSQRDNVYISIKKKSEFEYGEPNQNHTGIDQLFWYQIVIPFCNNIFRFTSERLNVGRSNVNEQRELNPDASNLSQALLNTKANNDSLYERFISYVSDVVPSVKWVTSVPVNGGSFTEIKVWTLPKETERDDLAKPLSDCGTGIGQILAILYVVVTSKEPRTIIIDEPNSFLHPSAAKKLIQILNKKEFSHHQYFISTHSPEIVTTANASTITMLKYVEGETIAEQLDLSTDNDKLKLVEELGMEMSDFFFAENVLWVEGPTEAKAFPMILKESVCLVNYVAVPLVSTDDLRDRKKGRKHARTIKENYDTLSGKYALTPPNIFTVLDREQTTPTEICDLQKLGIEFIPRCMYENYLLDAQAITDVLNAEMIDETNKITVEQVQAMLDSSFAECEDKTKWLAEVHSANLLYDIFSKLTDAKVRFDKTDHSIKLTKWLLANKPEELQELQDFLVKLLNTSKNSS
jgi:AAA15 family ATPase/GTPase